MDKDKIKKKRFRCFWKELAKTRSGRAFGDTGPDRKRCEELFGGYEADAAGHLKDIYLYAERSCAGERHYLIRYVSTTFFHFHGKSSHWIHPDGKSSGA